MRDDRPPRKDNTLLIVVGAVAAGFVIVAIVGIAMLAIGYAAKKAEQERPVQTTKVYERDELRKLVEGKSQEEVLNLLGTPNSTTDTGGDATWYYHEISRDKITGKIDYSAAVRFSNGYVRSVGF